ncbi:hypothetical protein [Cereibacter sphaeroides]|uniref:hypothetical protein n=1 Tax=Cereibacter sphaeroides TaxID=1063 RepID=UPI000AD21D34
MGGALRAILWLALVLALAGPERLKAVPDLSASGREIVLTLDMSGSMLIEDFDIDGVQSTRLEAVKRVARSFVEERQGRPDRPRPLCEPRLRGRAPDLRSGGGGAGHRKRPRSASPAARPPSPTGWGLR